MGIGYGVWAAGTGTKSCGGSSSFGSCLCVDMKVQVVSCVCHCQFHIACLRFLPPYDALVIDERRCIHPYSRIWSNAINYIHSPLLNGYRRISLARFMEFPWCWFLDFGLMDTHLDFVLMDTHLDFNAVCILCIFKPQFPLKIIFILFYSIYFLERATTKSKTPTTTAPLSLKYASAHKLFLLALHCRRPCSMSPTGIIIFKAP